VSPGGESGAPACYSGGDLSAVPDRRILHAAVINCQNLESLGEPHANVPVAAFGKFFLTLPLARAQTDLYVEMVGLVRPGDGVSFDVVQLYRLKHPEDRTCWRDEGNRSGGTSKDRR
jgi:hypothetical protein